jgi:sporulation-control protein
MGRGGFHMWKELLSSIGIGNAKVDTIVHNPSVKTGEKIKGEVQIRGGVSAQVIDEIVLLLYVQYREDKEDSDFTHHVKELSETRLEKIGTIQAGEERKIPFSIEIDKDHPKTDSKYETFLRTTLMVSQAVDPKDEDTIDVK